ISLGFGMYGGNNDGINEGFTRMNPAPSWSGTAPLYSYATNGNNNGSWYSIRGNIDYQRISRKNKERMFTLSYKISTRPSSSDSKFWYSDIKSTPEWSDYLDAVLLNQRSDGKQNSSEHTFQADYTTPIAKIHTLETGAKYIIRNNTSDNNRYNGEGVYDAYRSSHYEHLNDILAAYLGYGIKVKKFSGKAGVRYERTMQDVKYADKPERDFESNFNDVVPSASFGFKLTDMSNIRAGYDMRIWRPSIWYLNPYLDDTNPSYIRQGNPNLESEKSHAFNISYSNFTQKFNLNLSLRYSFNNSSIENVTSLVNDKDIEGLKNPTGKEVLYSTYYNIGKSSYAGLSAYVNWNATPKTRVYMNLNGDYAHLKSPAQNLESRGWNFFAYGGVQQTLPLDIRVSLNLMGQTPYISLQGKGSSYYDYSLSVNKSFLKEKRLTLSAFAGNFFHQYTKNSYTTEGVGFKNTSDSKYPRRRFGMSISYRIGELKASVKKASRSINNDDVKGGGGEGGGSN
ncbi:MAG: outer membrane beta-barrel family protein, partial [Bacteroides sp.]